MLEKTPESPLGSKEINPVNLNGNYFFWRVNTSCYYKGTRKNKKQLLFFLVFRFMQALEHKCFFQQCHVISLSHRSIIWLQKVKVKVTMSCVQLLWPRGLYTVHGILQARILEWVAFPFSRGIFPTQGSSPGLVHCRQILSQLSHKGSPRILNWVAYPFSSRFSWPRNWTRVSCIAGGFFTNWAIRETQLFRYELNQISYDYTVEVTNRLKGLDLVDRVPEELGMVFVPLYRRWWLKPSSRKIVLVWQKLMIIFP